MRGGELEELTELAADPRLSELGWGRSITDFPLHQTNSYFMFCLSVMIAITVRLPRHPRYARQVHNGLACVA